MKYWYLARTKRGKETEKRRLEIDFMTGVHCYLPFVVRTSRFGDWFWGWRHNYSSNVALQWLHQLLKETTLCSKSRGRCAALDLVSVVGLTSILYERWRGFSRVMLTVLDFLFCPLTFRTSCIRPDFPALFIASKYIPNSTSSRGYLQRNKSLSRKKKKRPRR